MREKLLRRHFFRQFVDNDLIGPGADRHEVLSVLLALLLTLSLFATFAFALTSIDPFRTPARTAIGAINARFHGVEITICWTVCQAKTVGSRSRLLLEPK